MKVLERMSKLGKQDYSIAELAAATGLPASSVYRILQTFAADNYVLADETTHLYRLGPALAALAQAAGGNTDLRSLAMPYLREIAEKTGDDAFLMSLNGYHSQTIAKAEGPNRIKIVESFEHNVDLHCGANRKMLLAFQSDDFISDYIKNGLKRYTANTITEPDDLWQEVRSIREEKVSFSLSEFIEGAMGVSAPVFDASGHLIASIGTSSPALQVSAAKINASKRVISDCAQKLSAALGYSEDIPVHYGK